MAIYTSRNVMICAVPAVVAIVTIIWFMRKKRSSELINDKKIHECNRAESSTQKSEDPSDIEMKLSSYCSSNAEVAEPAVLLEASVGAFNRPIKNDVNIFEVQLNKKNIFEVQGSSESKCSIIKVPESIDSMIEISKLHNQLQSSNTFEADNVVQDRNETNVIKLPDVICNESLIVQADNCNSDITRTDSEDVITSNQKDAADIINDVCTDESADGNDCQSSLSKEVTEEIIPKTEKILEYAIDGHNSEENNSKKDLIKSDPSPGENKEETIDNLPVYVDSALSQMNVTLETLDSNVQNTVDATVMEDTDSKIVEITKKDDKLSQNDNSMQQAITDETGNNSSQGHYSDVHSEGSSDSGKGGSDSQLSTEYAHFPMPDDGLSVYEFELPQDLCGRLIGKLGKSVNYIKNHSNANVFIKKHPSNPRMKLCTIEGNALEIGAALELIRRRFPPSQFPNITLTQFNTNGNTRGVPIPETLQLHLPEAVSCDVLMSSMVTAYHFFLQQPTHPTYPNLSRLDSCMAACYTQMETPQLPRPVEAGVICAAPVMSGWYRAQVVYVCENMEECDVKFVDYGGYSRVPISSLRQIRSDFMTLPFQASECYLANVQSLEEDGSWSIEACATFEELAQGHILQAQIVGYAEDSVPFVHLYKLQGISVQLPPSFSPVIAHATIGLKDGAVAPENITTTIFINRELVNRGVAQWIEHQ